MDMIDHADLSWDSFQRARRRALRRMRPDHGLPPRPPREPAAAVHFVIGSAPSATSAGAESMAPPSEPASPTH